MKGKSENNNLSDNGNWRSNLYQWDGLTIDLEGIANPHWSSGQSGKERMNLSITANSLLERAQARDKRFETLALECAEAGDHEWCWRAMALRAENKRFMSKLRESIER